MLTWYRLGFCNFRFSIVYILTFRANIKILQRRVAEINHLKKLTDKGKDNKRQVSEGCTFMLFATNISFLKVDSRLKLNPYIFILTS